MARRADNEPDPDALYVAVQGFSWDQVPGVPGVYPRGMRLRGSHPAVKACPRYWIAADSSDEEIAQRQFELGAPTLGIR